jgi:hypothetical protein
MKPQLTRTALLGLALTAWSPAAEPAAAPAPPAAPAAAPAAEAAEAAEAAPVNSELEAKRKEQEALATENKLQAEILTKETNAMRAEITRLKMERELMTEKQALETAKRQAALKDELAKLEAEKEKLVQEGELSKVRAEKLGNDLKAVQTEASIEITRLQNEIAASKPRKNATIIPIPNRSTSKSRSRGRHGRHFRPPHPAQWPDHHRHRGFHHQPHPILEQQGPRTADLHRHRLQPRRLGDGRLPHPQGDGIQRCAGPRGGQILRRIDGRRHHHPGRGILRLSECRHPPPPDQLAHHGPAQPHPATRVPRRKPALVDPLGTPIADQDGHHHR